MYCHIMTCCGQTWTQIDHEWDVPRLCAFNRYSAQFPPVHVLVARYLDYKPPADASAPAVSLEEHAARMISQLTNAQ